MSKRQAELKKQQDIWYKKLAASGFEDIEQDENLLKRWASSAFTGKVNGARYDEKKSAIDATEEYYRIAGHFLYEHKFSSAFERTIWEMHSEGKSLRDISKALRNSIKLMKTNKDNINPIVKKLADIMLTKYKRDQDE